MAPVGVVVMLGRREALHLPVFPYPGGNLATDEAHIRAEGRVT
jgi:hypothetical protein